MASFHGSDVDDAVVNAVPNDSSTARRSSSVVLRLGGIEQVAAIDPQDPEQVMEWLTSATLVVVVVGASGDLAKKKTYPSLLNLYDDNLLPKQTVIYGYARSKLTDDELRDRLRPYLLKTDHSPDVVERFLQHCFYQGGSSYGDLDAYAELSSKIEGYEVENLAVAKRSNRLFYFAIPPNVFAETALAIKQTCMQDDSKGFTRLIVEKTVWS